MAKLSTLEQAKVSAPLKKPPERQVKFEEKHAGLTRVLARTMLKAGLKQ